MTQPSTTHLRSLYRLLLRELPPLSPSPSPSTSILPSNPPSKTSTTTTTTTPLRHRLRASFRSPPPSRSSTQRQRQRQQEAEQFLQYLRAQRRYATLLERYNPGMGEVDEVERVRLSARRVGMEMPEGWYGRGEE